MIETFTGKFVTIPGLSAKDVCIEDIAHSLSMQCRFNGHCREFYSVAEHSILVAEWLDVHDHAPPTLLRGLLHDAGEAYISDVPTPMKALIPIVREYESEIMEVIAESFGLSCENTDDASVIKMADRALLVGEARVMLKSRGSWIGCERDEDPAISIRFLGPSEAEAAFLARFQELSAMCESAWKEPEGVPASFFHTPEHLTQLGDD